MSNGKLDNFLQNKQQETQPQPQNTFTETQELNPSEQIVGLVESLYSDYKPIVAIAGQLLSIKIASEINAECHRNLLKLSNGEAIAVNGEAIAEARKRLAIGDKNQYSKRLLLSGVSEEK